MEGSKHERLRASMGMLEQQSVIDTYEISRSIKKAEEKKEQLAVLSGEE